MTTRRLPTGTLGAERLLPLEAQVRRRFEWLRRNHPDAPEDELVEQIAQELNVGPGVMKTVMPEPPR